MRSDARSDVQATTKGLDRRGFLKGGAAAIVIAGVSPWLAGGSSTAVASPFTRAQFEALVGQWFHVGGASWQAVQLVAVQDGPSSARADQFSLVFAGSPNASLAEGTYTVVPPTGPAFDLFLQPRGADPAQPMLSASFSLLAPAPLAPSCAAPA